MTTDTTRAAASAAILAAQVSEKRLLETIIGMARLLGWEVYHTFDSRRSEPGFPDLVLVHPEQQSTLFLELKTMRGRISADQRRWIDALYAAGQQVYVIRPSQMDFVEMLLRGEAA